MNKLINCEYCDAKLPEPIQVRGFLAQHCDDCKVWFTSVASGVANRFNFHVFYYECKFNNKKYFVESAFFDGDFQSTYVYEIVNNIKLESKTLLIEYNHSNLELRQSGTIENIRLKPSNLNRITTLLNFG